MTFVSCFLNLSCTCLLHLTSAEICKHLHGRFKEISTLLTNRNFHFHRNQFPYSIAHRNGGQYFGCLKVVQIMLVCCLSDKLWDVKGHLGQPEEREQVKRRGATSVVPAIHHTKWQRSKTAVTAISFLNVTCNKVPLCMKQ